MKVVSAALLVTVTVALGGCAHKAHISKETECLPSAVEEELRTIDAQFGKVHIVSTYRPGAKIAGTNITSYHAYCRAVDFNVRGNGAQQRAASYLRASWEGGFGTYSSKMHHLHIDNGSRRRWQTHVR